MGGTWLALVRFVSGGPMEADQTRPAGVSVKLDAIDQGGLPGMSDEGLEQVERSTCSTCGSCSGMFTAKSTNCLTEILGLALPGKRHPSRTSRRSRTAVLDRGAVRDVSQLG